MNSHIHHPPHTSCDNSHGVPLFPTLSCKYFNRVPLGHLLVLLLGILLADGTFSVAKAALGDRAGHSQLQSRTGSAIQTTCGQLNTLHALTPLTGDRLDLRTQCRAMVQTANDIDNTGATAESLGLTENELASGLQQIAGEEIAAPRTMASKTFNGQQRNLSARMAALRGGVRGFSISGLNFDGLPRLAQERTMNPAGIGFTPRGGGASGDIGDFGRLGVFLNGVFSFGDKDETSKEDGFDFDSQGATLGVDYRLLDSLVLGTAFSYSHFDADFDKSSVNSGGGSETDGYVFSLYSTYYLQNFYLEGIASIGWNDHDSKRRIVVPSTTTIPAINRTAKGKTDSRQYSFSLGAGYDIPIQSFDFGPYARLSYLRVDIDGYKEKGAQGLNLEIDDQYITSLISAIGLRASKKFSWNWGVWYPQIRGEWDHEFANDSKTISTQYAADPNNNALLIKTESPDRNFFRVGATLAHVSQGGTSAFIDYETMLGFRDITNHVFTVGVRQEF